MQFNDSEDPCSECKTKYHDYFIVKKEGKDVVICRECIIHYTFKDADLDYSVMIKKR